jgi:uncharacterized repeat protein (TIGR04138 family)
MDFYQKIEEIIRGDKRYKPDAYDFVMRALAFTQKKLKRQGHMSGRELCDGIRQFATEQYGPMALAVFKHWGITSTEDFGRIVFNMVASGVMSKTEQDSPDDFKAVYDLKEVFDVFKIISDTKV